jgi:hypothetical protein
MYALLIDPSDNHGQLSGRVLSCHRGLDAMRKAANKHLAAVRRQHGCNSYVRLVPAKIQGDEYLRLSSGEADEYYEYEPFETG